MRPVCLLLVALIFEGHPDLGPVGFHLALRDHHVLLDDFRYAELAQGMRCCVYGCLGRVLPGFCAGPDQSVFSGVRQLSVAALLIEAARMESNFDGRSVPRSGAC